jgi:hypothetical protein
MKNSAVPPTDCAEEKFEASVSFSLGVMFYNITSINHLLIAMQTNCKKNQEKKQSHCLTCTCRQLTGLSSSS